ncbi:MAG: acyltransferase family protein [Janthinobacterium lividum]
MKNFSAIVAPGMFRLILAITVMVSHTLPFKVGTSAVYLFFVLSGYWIYRMWNREYAPLAKPVLTFYISRAWRIFPTALFVSALLFLCAKPLGLWNLTLPPLDSFAAFHFYFSHLFLVGYSSLDTAHRLIVPLWSLDNELQFYIISPLVIWVLTRKKGVSLEKAVLLAIALAGLYFVMFRFGFDSTVGWIPNYLIFFLIGMVGASVEWRPSSAAIYGGIALAVALVGVCIVMPPLRGIFLSGRFTSDLTILNPIGNLALGFLLAPYAIATTKKKSAPLDRIFGNISFEIYLVHEAVLIAMHRFIGTDPGEPLSGSLTFRYTVIFGLYVLIIAISLLIYFYVDSPIDGLRRRWMKNRARAAGPT